MTTWPDPRHIYTGLRGQQPRALRFPGGRPGRDAEPVQDCSECGYHGLFIDGACPCCVQIPKTDAMWWSVLMESVSRRAHVRQRISVSVSRNDPCPCGSGKKAKKCCHA